MNQPVPLHQELPERADEEIVARQIHVTLGGAPHILRVLTIEENRPWQGKVGAVVRERITEHGLPSSLEELFLILSLSIDVMLDLIIEYDADHVLPERSWIDANGTDGEVYVAMKRVTAAAYPFGFDLREIVPQLVPWISDALARGVAAGTVTWASSVSMRRLLQPTAGRRTSSKRSSPTNSSTATSKS